MVQASQSFQTCSNDYKQTSVMDYVPDLSSSQGYYHNYIGIP